MRSELGTEAQAQVAVFELLQTVLIQQTAIPIVAFPEDVLTDLSANRVTLPLVAHFTKQFNGVAIGQLPLIAEGGIERVIEQETSIESKVLVFLPGHRSDTHHQRQHHSITLPHGLYLLMLNGRWLSRLLSKPSAFKMSSYSMGI